MRGGSQGIPLQKCWSSEETATCTEYLLIRKCLGVSFWWEVGNKSFLFFFFFLALLLWQLLFPYIKLSLSCSMSFSSYFLTFSCWGQGVRECLCGHLTAKANPTRWSKKPQKSQSNIHLYFLHEFHRFRITHDIKNGALCGLVGTDCPPTLSCAPNT